jgi:dTDP-4-amino-4,6-dideoxygalactose transaminase
VRRLGVFLPNRENAEVSPELQEAFDRVLRSGQYLLGPELEAFEHELADYLGVRHAVGVGSGTDALILGMRAAGIGPGDEVLVPAFGAVPTAAAVVEAGATPAFCDVSESTGCVDPAEIEERVGPRTAAVVVVHLYGYPCDAHALRRVCDKRGILLIEDCAQAFGARSPETSQADGSRPAEHSGIPVGKAGHIGCFSFYPTKVLACLGDAGAVVTDDESIAEKVKLLRAHGHVGGYRHSVVARNSRLDEFQAAFLRVKLKRIDDWLSKRRLRAEGLRRSIAASGSANVVFQSDAPGHAYHLLAARHPRREALLVRLREQGFDAMVHYPLTIPEQEAFAHLSALAGSKSSKNGGIEEVFPHAWLWSRTEFSLPTAPQMTEEESERLAEAVIEAASSVG